MADERPKDVKCMTLCCPARYMFAVLAAVGMAIIYGLKVNLSVAIVAMVNHTFMGTTEKGTECPVEGGPAAKKDGPIQWTHNQEGFVLASYFYGYLVGQIPGAYMAHSFSAKWTMLIAVIINMLGCAVSPAIAVYTHVGVFCFVRALQGLAGGMTFPVAHEMISAWAPPAERSLISGIIYAGTAAGTVISTLMAGFITNYMNWEWSFYLMAALCVPWCGFWAWFIGENPTDARYIKESEQKMIVESQAYSKEEEKFPLAAVCKSVPFWAILLTHLGGNTGWYTILTQMPKFMSSILHKDMKQNAVMSAIPYALNWLVSVLLGWILTTLRKKGKITTAVARKVATGICLLGSAALYIGITFIKCNDLAGTAIFIVIVALYGAMFVGYLSNHIDIAPNHAAMLIGMTNTVATIPGIMMPSVVSMVVKEQTLGRWSIVFYLLAAVNVTAYICFQFMGSGEIQSWNSAGDAAGG